MWCSAYLWSTIATTAYQHILHAVIVHNSMLLTHILTAYSDFYILWSYRWEPATVTFKKERHKWVINVTFFWRWFHNRIMWYYISDDMRCVQISGSIWVNSMINIWWWYNTSVFDKLIWQAQRASYLALHSTLFGPVVQLIMIILSLTALTLS